MNDPFLITEPTVISFSGGRTSAYMLWRVLESNKGLPKEAIVAFANTGKEHESTLKFVNDCEKHWKVKIHWLEYQSDKPGYKFVNFQTASRNGEPFDKLIKKKNYLPNTFARFCTSELKINVFKKAFPDHLLTFVGIRADEPRRVAKMANNKDEKFCPLAVANVSQAEVMEFWSKQSFDLDLITIQGNALLGNCDLCFMKKMSHKVALIKNNPQSAIWWIKKEQSLGSVFRQDHPSYKEMLMFAERQSDMFDSADESLSCFCGD